jgi:hypothetical protein
MTILRLTAVMCLGLVVGCGDSGLSPTTWFGRDHVQKVRLIPKGGFPQDEDDRGRVDQVTELAVEPAIGGGVVRATGIPPVQGYWDAELVSTDNLEPVDGVLTLEFRIRPPEQPTLIGPPRSREVTAAIFVSRQKLDRTREIRVLGAGTSRSVRR